MQHASHNTNNNNGKDGVNGNRNADVQRKQTYVTLNSYEIFFIFAYRRCRQLMRKGKTQEVMIADIRTMFPDVYAEILPFLHGINKDDALSGWSDGYLACIEGEELGVEDTVR